VCCPDGWGRSAAHSPQPAARSPQPTAHSPQPAAHSPQPAAHSPSMASDCRYFNQIKFSMLHSGSVCVLYGAHFSGAQTKGGSQCKCTCVTYLCHRDISFPGPRSERTARGTGKPRGGRHMTTPNRLFLLLLLRLPHNLNVTHQETVQNEHVHS
jgi:hypothetical protein